MLATEAREQAHGAPGLCSAADYGRAWDIIIQAHLTCKRRLAYHPVVSDVFEALSAPVRRVILDELYERDGQTLYELCTRLTMNRQQSLTRQAISQHLNVLESAGLISTVRKGRCKIHYIDPGPLAQIAKRWPYKKTKGEKS